jgi:predicted dehydrogenase
VPFDPADQYTIQAELFGQAIRDGAPTVVDPSDAVANMRVIDALLAV